MQISPITLALIASTIVAKEHRPRHLGIGHNDEPLIQRRDPQQNSSSDNLPEITVTVTTCSKLPVATVTVTTCKPRTSETAVAQQTDSVETSAPAQANEAAIAKVAWVAAAAPLVAALLY